ncbi:OapC/ArvC family zinc-ribbon domain-containing protein [Halovenus sp. HT40]|uniref:OapC/ArvC family zinc-ribbon domain-containing protein n=1 Tax=Halovenus sp. HT40 TaxID=3126691 RepID=UPI00300F6670
MPHQCTDCGRQFDDGSKEMLSGCPSCGGTKFQFLPDGHADQEPTPEEPPSVEEPGSSVARKVGSAATAVRDFVGSSAPESNSPASTERPPTPESSSGAQSQRSELSTPAEPKGSELSTTAERSEGTATSSPGTTERRSEPASPSTGGPETATSADSLRESESASMQTADSENDAQASARSEVISPEELPPKPEQSGWEQTTPGPQTEPEPDEPEQTERPDLSELRAELNQQFESIKVLEPGQYELNLMELFDREEYIIALQEDGKYTVQVPEHWQD